MRILAFFGIVWGAWLAFIWWVRRTEELVQKSADEILEGKEESW